MTRMFEVGGQRVKTWNPVTGCLFGCSYCWARRLAETRLKHLPQYKGGFKPNFDDTKLRTFKSGTMFVSSMGDMWGPWVSAKLITIVLDSVRRSPNATFYLLTKNPARYLEFADKMPPNVVLGATIESNRAHEVSTAPLGRGIEMIASALRYPQVKRFVSIEPILDFDLEEFVDGLRQIAPAFVYVGMDNYPQRNHLPEPPLAKTRALIAELRKFTEVREKSLREAI